MGESVAVQSASILRVRQHSSPGPYCSVKVAHVLSRSGGHNSPLILLIATIFTPRDMKKANLIHRFVLRRWLLLIRISRRCSDDSSSMVSFSSSSRSLSLTSCSILCESRLNSVLRSSVTKRFKVDCKQRRPIPHRCYKEYSAGMPTLRRILRTAQRSTP